MDSFHNDLFKIEIDPKDILNEPFLTSSEEEKNQSYLLLDIPLSQMSEQKEHYSDSKLIFNQNDTNSNQFLKKKISRKYSGSKLEEYREKNRESAKRSRAKKKKYLIELKSEVIRLKKENEELKSKIQMLCPHCQNLFFSIKKNDEPEKLENQIIGQTSPIKNISFRRNITYAFQKRKFGTIIGIVALISVLINLLCSYKPANINSGLRNLFYGRQLYASDDNINKHYLDKRIIENKKQNYKKYALQHGVFIKNKDFNSIKDNTFGFTHPQLKNLKTSIENRNIPSSYVKVFPFVNETITENYNFNPDLSFSIFIPISEDVKLKYENIKLDYLDNRNILQVDCLVIGYNIKNSVS